MIGLFDSGVGGLYSLRELRRLLPDADLCYYADEAHLPYGGRPPHDLLRLSSRAIRFLLEQGAGAILIACGTVSSTVYRRLAQECPVPLFDAATPLALAAAALAESIPHARLLLLATAGSVKAGVIADFITAARPDATVTAHACPDFVSLAERLSPETEGEAEAAVRQTLTPFAHGHYDAALLGCTHFSALAAPISRALGGIPTLDGAALAARAPAETLPKKRQGLGGKTILYTNGESRAFARAAAHILGKELPVLRAYENKNY
jgi:glutamate racemase